MHMCLNRVPPEASRWSAEWGHDPLLYHLHAMRFNVPLFCVCVPGLGDMVTDPLNSADCENFSRLSANCLVKFQVRVPSSNLCMEVANAPLAMGQDRFSASLMVSLSSVNMNLVTAGPACP